MKSSAYLISTARGWIVDEKALYLALRDKGVAGAALGAELHLGSVLAAEIVSGMGIAVNFAFDFVLVDNQHGLWDIEKTASAFRSISLGSAVPMARVEQNDFYAIGSFLDRGVLGIIVPLVETVKQARAAAFAVRYSRTGGRSSGPMGTLFHGKDYQKWIDDEVFLAIQIESKLAVE